jgi:hypothetical protein
VKWDKDFSRRDGSSSHLIRGSPAQPVGTSLTELVIGVPYEEVNGVTNAGTVKVIQGSALGLIANGAQSWNQSSDGVPGVPELNDHFGWSLAAGSFGKGDGPDLAVGILDEDASSTDAGAVNVLYGSGSALSSNGAELWYQGTVGIQGRPRSIRSIRVRSRGRRLRRRNHG